MEDGPLSNKTMPMPATLDGWAEKDDDERRDETPQLLRPLNELYEGMYPRCPSIYDVEDWIDMYRLRPDAEPTLLAPHCEQAIYDAQDPNMQTVHIGGVLYKNDDDFPDPEKLIFVITRSSPTKPKRIFECVSFQSLDVGFYRARANYRVINVDEPKPFYICKWFETFSHESFVILLKEEAQYDERCTCSPE